MTLRKGISLCPLCPSSVNSVLEAFSLIPDG